jgi:hypothetical protein
MKDKLPVNMATKRDRPIPTGATKVAFVFSAASIRTVMTSSAVRNISIKTPCAIEVPFVRVVRTLNGPGKMHFTTPAAAMPATIWVGKKKAARIHGSWSAIDKPSVTCRGVSINRRLVYCGTLGGNFGNNYYLPPD